MNIFYAIFSLGFLGLQLHSLPPAHPAPVAHQAEIRYSSAGLNE